MNMNTKNVKNYRTRAKNRLVEIFGGSCNICGYNKTVTALEYHHIDESTKEFGISERGWTRSFERVLNEAKKCIMVCSNCHREIHAGLIDLSKYPSQFNDDIAQKYINVVNNTKKKTVNCCVCGKEKPNNQQFCSKKCFNENKKPRKLLVTDDILFQLYNDVGNYEEVGRQFGVTGAAVKRRLRKIMLE